MTCFSSASLAQSYAVPIAASSGSPFLPSRTSCSSSHISVSSPSFCKLLLPHLCSITAGKTLSHSSVSSPLFCKSLVLPFRSVRFLREEDEDNAHRASGKTLNSQPLRCVSFLREGDEDNAHPQENGQKIWTQSKTGVRSVSFLRGGDEEDNTHPQKNGHKIRTRSKTGVAGAGDRSSCKTRSQEELLERIAHEVLRRREGDRESTAIVRALTWACRGATVASDVDAIVADLDLPLPIFTSAVQKLGMEGRPEAAVAVFQWLRAAPGRRPNVYTYNSLLGALKANGRHEAAHSVFQQMKVSSVVPDVVTFNTLISLYEQQGQFDDALELFNGLRALSVEPTLFTFRNIIQILGKKRDVETALDVFKEFKQQQVCKMDAKDSQRTVELKRDSEQRQQLERIMTQLCCERLGELISQDRKTAARALQFLDRLKGAQIQLDAQAYEKLIRAFGEEGEGDHKVVRVLFRHMQQQQVQMTVSLCNYVIQVLVRSKKWWVALEVYDHMMQYGPEPNAFTFRLLLLHFRALLKAASKRRTWKWSLQLLDKMIEKGVEPDQFAWNAALISCAKAGQTAPAVFVFQKMTERGHKPGVVSYGALLSALEKSAFLPAAELVWEHMWKVGLKPNIVAYTTMISLYGKAGKYSEAMLLVEDMRGAGIEPSVVTFNALITACARAGDGERALGLVEQMKAEWIQPDAVTYAQLIEALANEGRWESATATYSKMQELKLEPPPYAHDAVVRVCKANNVPFDLQPASSPPKA